MRPNILPGFLLLLFLYLTGEALVHVFHFPLPGAVIGMLLFLVLSLIKKEIAPSVTDASHSLLSHMGLLFIPAGVGLIDQLPFLEHEGLSMLAALIGSIVLTVIATVLTFQWLMRRVPHEPTE